jgi:hypothetical protein
MILLRFMKWNGGLHIKNVGAVQLPKVVSDGSTRTVTTSEGQYKGCDE